MNRSLAWDVVCCLRYSSERFDLDRLRRHKAKEWQRTFRWLDSSGLGLYFLARLRELRATSVLPAPVLARLEQNLANNRQRTDCIANEFALINDGFRSAGITFAVVKGFSLVPEFCADAVLRTPCDLDYLVDEVSLRSAKRLLCKAGYLLKRSSDIEFKFARPCSRIPSLSDSPYSCDTEPMVELHLGFWNATQNRIAFREPKFDLDRAVLHQWRGLRFPALAEEDSFLLQIVHTFQHIVECWIKLGWLFEIGHFMKKRERDVQFWSRVDRRIAATPALSEFAAIVVGLAKIAFATPTPTVVEKWSDYLRPLPRLWLKTYGQTWLIEDHPLGTVSLFSAAKLSHFLHMEYVPDLEARNMLTRARLVPWKRPEHIAQAAQGNSAGRWAFRWLQWKFLLQRLAFHVGSNLRYLAAVPRWRRMMRTSIRSAKFDKTFTVS